MESIEKEFLSNYLRLVLLADNYYINANNVVAQIQNKEHPWHKLTEHSEFGFEAVAVAANLIQASANSYLSLKLLTYAEPSLEAEQDRVHSVRVTINGSAGLIRQVLENAAYAKWLLSAVNSVELDQRGFAAIWHNASESFKFHKALGSREMKSVEAHLHSLRQQGMSYGYFSRNGGDEYSRHPIVQFSNVTEILKNVVFVFEPVPKEIRDSLGHGFESAEWTYRWLSGLAHGASWVHDFSDPGVTHNIQPDWPRLTYGLLVAQKVLDQSLHLLIKPSLTAK